MSSTAESSGSGHDATVDPSSTGVRFTQYRQQGSALGGGGDGVTHCGSVLESSPAQCRGYAAARKRFTTSRSRLCFSFPVMAHRRGLLERLPARRRRHTARPRLLLSPTRFLPLPPSLLLAAADQESEKPPMRLVLREGLDPGGCRARSRRRRGKDGHKALPLVAPLGAATWPASNGGHVAFSVTSRGKRGTSPSRNP
jgi:hypothetical protein